MLIYERRSLSRCLIDLYLEIEDLHVSSTQHDGDQTYQ